MSDTEVLSADRVDDWHLQDAAAVLRALRTDKDRGLSTPVAAARLAEYGPNTVRPEAKPSRLQITLVQLRDPMNLMLIAVSMVAIGIGEGATAAIVIALILLNVIMGANQQLKAQASVDALAGLQVPQSKVLRDGVLTLIPAADLVPGDVVSVEAGDLVPADGRLITAATLETQEAALTGESMPVGKNAATVIATVTGTDSGGDVPLGDRSDMLFQNTPVTRGTATMVVTATGMNTEVGRIAAMLTAVRRTRSPLQQQLDNLTSKIGIIAGGTLAIILIVGLIRGLPFSQLMLLGISMAISAIPTGMPTFVQSMLALGAQQLATAKAIVRNLTDVETLGATSQINTDKTGTLTLNEMTVRALYYAGGWYTVDGEGYSTTDRILAVAGAPVADFTSLACVSALASDATVNDRGEIVGDPTEAAVVVLAEKIGVPSRKPAAPIRGSRPSRSTRPTSSWPRSTGFPTREPSAWSGWSRAARTSCSPDVLAR